MLNLEEIYFIPDITNVVQISTLTQDLKVGDKVKCYEEDSTDENYYIGEAYITEVLDSDANYFWCVAMNSEIGVVINFAYYCVKI